MIGGVEHHPHARLRLILDNRATILLCTPTYALHLAQVARENGIVLAPGAAGFAVRARAGVLVQASAGLRAPAWARVLASVPAGLRPPACAGILVLIRAEFRVAAPAGTPALIRAVGCHPAPGLNYLGAVEIFLPEMERCRCLVDIAEHSAKEDLVFVVG